MMTESDCLNEHYFQPEQQIICGQIVQPITESYNNKYTSFVDRFFKRYYYIKKGSQPEPYQILFHTNRVCLICLAPEHPAFAKGITGLTFNIGHADRSKNTVKGKAKKGGMILQPDSTLAILSTNTGETYKIPSCIRSKLVEVNTEWQTNPKKLETSAEGENYIAIVLPKPEHCDEIKASLVSEEQYQEYKKATLPGIIER